MGESMGEWVGGWVYLGISKADTDADEWMTSRWSSCPDVCARIIPVIVSPVL